MHRKPRSNIKKKKEKKKSSTPAFPGERKVTKFPRPQLTIIRAPLLQDEVVVELVLQWSFTLNSSSNQNYRFYANSYKPVVASSTPTYNMFATYATEFDFYCPTKLKTEFECDNTEAFPVAMYTGFFNDDPGVNPGTSLLSNPLTMGGMLSPATGLDRDQFAMECSMQQIIGRRGNVTQDPNYRSPTLTSSPADLLWFSIGARSLTGANFTTGVVVNLKLTMWTQFFARKMQ
jgi:hypothetical protein